MKASEHQAAKAAADQNKDEESTLYSVEYYAAQKAKRQGLGLITFISELFKLQMLTECIMHEWVKKLLGNVKNPEEEEIESLCKLLTTVGQILAQPRSLTASAISHPAVSSRSTSMVSEMGSEGDVIIHIV
ncbi:armadillo-type protein [Ganoderma leucocontextum]|nr:armadillo-type protein [Ganoderma leucocontextum]